MKQTLIKNYICTKPKKVVFGDPSYFEDYADNKKRLKDLTINMNLNTKKYNEFECLVSLRKTIDEDFSEDMYSIVISLINAKTCGHVKGLYVSNMQYEDQKLNRKIYGVDTAEYYVSIDDKDDWIKTGADGYWAEVSTYTRKINGTTITDAVLVEINMPDDFSEKEVEKYINYFFKDLKEVSINSNYQLVHKK